MRDLVVAIRSETSQPRVLGLVAEVFGRRRIFVPMTRVTHIDSGQVYTTGLLNMRRFEQRPTETLVIGQMLDRTVTIEPDRRAPAPSTTSRWSRPAPATGCSAGSRSRSPARACGARGPDPRRGVARRRRAWSRREPTQGATHLIAALNEMRPADAANVIHDLPPERRTAVVARPRRRAPRRRPRGAARGGPGRDPRAPRQRARRRRPRGDVARRRRRPDRRPAARDRRPRCSS